jgi:hypothetical protein
MPSKANSGENQPFLIPARRLGPKPKIAEQSQSWRKSAFSGPNASAFAAGAIRPAVKLKTAEQSQFREAMNARPPTAFEPSH